MRGLPIRRVAGLSSLALLVAASPAHAEPAVAAPCAEDPAYCARGPLSFETLSEAPFEIALDSGWVPKDANLQLRLYGGLYAHTSVYLGGTLETRWPEALTLAAPGGEGSVGFRYGLELGAEGHVHFEWQGKQYQWTGKIPFAPQLDAQVSAEAAFEGWAFSPGASVSDASEAFEVASVGLADVVGGSIPGADGGFQLRAQIELEARYVTERITITTPEGEEVSGGAITQEDLESLAKAFGGPAVEFDLRPQGFVEYDGKVHLIPTFFVEFGKTWLWPLAAVAVPVSLPSAAWTFPARRVRVPLPDISLPARALDFGAVEVGETATRAMRVGSAGEAALVVALASANPEVFEIAGDPFEVGPGEETEIEIVFSPTVKGAFEAAAFVASNDPDAPLEEVVLSGRAGMPAGAEVDPAGDELEGRVEEPAGCACRAGLASSGGAGLPGATALAAIGVLGATRRRRRSCGGPA